MDDLAILLPLAAFVALAAGAWVVFRRTDSIARRNRELDAFKVGVRGLSARIDTSLEGATSRIDAVRRQQVAADTVGPIIAAATDAVERYVDEARALRGPAEAMVIRDELVADLERAGRALQMVDHGASVLAQVRRRGRELEAQTSLKRGYLNLMHAREAIARHAAEADALEVAAVVPGEASLSGERASPDRRGPSPTIPPTIPPTARDPRP